MPEVTPARPAPAAPRFRPEPASGRVFAAERAVRSTDVTPAGRFRLDALARYLQDVAEDDVTETGWQAPYGWLLRRMSVAIGGYPGFGERLRLRTFCTATGPRWAERTTTVAGPGGDLMQATALWVAADRETGRPVPLGGEFHRIYGEATQGRQVSSRLSLPGPETARPGPETAQPGSAGGRDWPLRAADFDPAGHVNNSVYWAALEDVLAGLDWLPSAAELEYHRPLLPGCHPRLVTSDNGDDGVYAWLLGEQERMTSGLLTR
jgi:acyl-ACP thioesterase